ncbi:hypothetical protein [Alicycliphilus denitrificans]|uniref:hypothetical protein n=1 Tax=Alicycliphilus denitrificans TaxID=179636 RepID=UPI00384AE9AB
MPKYPLRLETRPQCLPDHCLPEEGAHGFASTITHTRGICAQPAARHWIMPATARVLH